MATPDQLIQDAQKRMDASVEHTKTEFNTVRTGRASAALLDRVQIDYYGQVTPLNQMAQIGAPEPRLLTIQPYDPTQIKAIERAIHGVAPDELHLHEVGAVDAILDIVGSIWGVEMLGIERLYNTKVSLGDGTVKTAHGLLPVPAPATIRLLEGFNVHHGPPGSGELTTPTGAALITSAAIGELTARLAFRADALLAMDCSP